MTHPYEEKARELAERLVTEAFVEIEDYGEEDGMDAEYFSIEKATKLLADFGAACAREEREACKADIQDAIGDWGGPEREHYTAAMHRAISAIENRAKGLDLWGQPLERAATERVPESASMGEKDKSDG